MTQKIKITFLGTSGAFPTSKRNHPAFLLNYSGENILVDCGEGTQRQFRKAKLNPGKITKLLITHWHGDHVLGIPGLLQSLSLSGYNKTLFIYGPKGIEQHMKNLLKAFPSYNNIKIEIKEVSKEKFFESDEFYIESEIMEHGTLCNAYNFVIKDKLRIDKIKLKKLKIPEGKHLSELLKGKKITLNKKTYKTKDLTYIEKGKKVSFILDTLDNKKIAPFVKEAKLLIIESTFASNEEELAKEHKHMTVKQSCEEAKKAKVENLALVHISDRYEDNFSGILNEAKEIFKKTFIPKDLDEFEI